MSSRKIDDKMALKWVWFPFFVVLMFAVYPAYRALHTIVQEYRELLRDAPWAIREWARWWRNQ